MAGGTYKNVSNVPIDLPGGQQLGVGETADLKKDQLNDNGIKDYIETGYLLAVESTSKSKEEG